MEMDTVCTPTDGATATLDRAVSSGERAIDDEDAAGASRNPLARRLLEGRRAGARAGRHQSGAAPYGYLRDYAAPGPGIPLIPHPEESKVVRRIFRLYLSLQSMKRLCEILDAEGVKTRRGKRWSRPGIAWILKNETYVGRVHFGGIRTRGTHSPLVAPIVFHKIQRIIRQNDRSRRGEPRE